MSAEATFWAWKQQGITSSAKLVLLCLADCHNASTGRCDPSAKYIAEKSELNIKTIPTALKTLEQFGLIAIEKRAGTSPNYILHLTQNRGTPKTGIPENGITQKRIEDTPNLGEGGTPKTGNEPINKPKKNLKPDSFKNFFAAYPENKKGGRDESAWKKAKSLKLTDSDYEAMLDDLAKRKALTPKWFETFAPGICKYLDDHIWKTPVIAEKENGAGRKDYQSQLKDRVAATTDYTRATDF